jgi:hypothetical protein
MEFEFKWYTWVAVLNLIALVLAFYYYTSPSPVPSQVPSPVSPVSVPFTNLEMRLARAIEQASPSAYLGPPDISDELARAVASKMKSYPVEYNKPSNLLLGDSTPVQLVIKTNEQQKIQPYLKNFEGQVTWATVRVANDISAQLTGPPDRLKITLRGDKMRTILSPDPITWVWDVEPLKPGPAQVTLEVTSYIKTGKDTEPVPIRVLQDTWLVEARGIEWAKYQIAQIEPIQAFIFTIITAVAGVSAWFGIKGWKRGHDFES